MKHIVCFHLFNDFSGSPKVLRSVLGDMAEKKVRIDLVTSKGDGALSDLAQYGSVRTCMYAYRFSENPVITMLRYCGVQLYTFLLAFRWIFHKNVVFYINTLLPAGPALAGRIMGKRVVYHYHENACIKGAFYRMLAVIMQKLAHEIICVSKYQASFLKRNKGVTVIPNALPKEFTDRIAPNAEAAFKRKTVLMLSSLKAYKGTKEFIELASCLPQYKFVLVINDSRENIDKFLVENNLVDIERGNCCIHSRQSDVTGFYNESSLVLNLSDKEKCVETFGLTALEAMSAGLPVIVPTEGGIAEMVEDGVNGYKIDVQDLDQIKKRIHDILSDKQLFISLSNNSKEVSERYNVRQVIKNIEDVINR